MVHTTKKKLDMAITIKHIGERGSEKYTGLLDLEELFKVRQLLEKLGMRDD